MTKTYEAWHNPDDNSYMCGTTASVEEYRSKKLLSENARLLYRFTAATHEEAQSIHSLRMGWGPYKPNGGPGKCPNCGAWFYPEVALNAGAVQPPKLIADRLTS